MRKAKNVKIRLFMPKSRLFRQKLDQFRSIFSKRSAIRLRSDNADLLGVSFCSGMGLGFSNGPCTVSLKEAFGQKNVPHHKNIAGSSRNCSRWSLEVTAKASIFTFPSRGWGWLEQVPFVQILSTHPKLQQGWLPCPGLIFQVRDCPKCLSL